MATNLFQNYSFSNSLKSLVDPFAQLLKKPATSTTPSALFTPAPPKPATPALNYSPYTPAPNASTLAGPKYFAPPVIPQVKPTQSTAVSTQKPAGAPVLPKITPSATPGTPPAPMIPPPAPGTPTGTQESAPGGASTPATPSVSPEALKALELAQSAYESSLKLSPDELSTQEDLDKLIESTKTAYRNTSNQAIPLEFITGQLASVERRATGLAEPLERKLGRLQAARTSSLEASKFALDRADKAVSGERDRIATAKTEAESARRFGVTTGLTEKSQAQSKLEADRKFEEDKRQFGLDYAIKQREIGVKESEAKKTGSQSGYQAERSTRILGSVDDLTSRVSNKTVGVGSYAAAIRGTEAFNFKSDLDNLKANIAFGELQAMREASKTGGALGAISEKELTLLESSLGALNQGQSPENFNKNLQKIRDSLARWDAAVAGTSLAATSSTGGASTFVGPSGTTYKLPY